MAWTSKQQKIPTLTHTYVLQRRTRGSASSHAKSAGTHTYMRERGTRVNTTLQPKTSACGQHHNTAYQPQPYLHTAEPDTTNHIIICGNHIIICGNHTHTHTHMHMDKRGTRVNSALQSNTPRRGQQHNTTYHTNPHTHVLAAAPGMTTHVIFFA